MLKTNAPQKPQVAGQIVSFISPHANVILYDQAWINPKYGYLEWRAINNPSDEQKDLAIFLG